MAIIKALSGSQVRQRELSTLERKDGLKAKYGKNTLLTDGTVQKGVAMPTIRNAPCVPREPTSFL